VVLTDADVEQLAAAAHENFRNGAGSDSLSAGLEYSQLPEEMQESNRASVRAIPEIIAELGYRLERVATITVRPIESFTDAEVERAARLEHERWMRRAANSGLRYGPTRDDAARTHPDLVEWERLDDGAREKDRERIRGIPALVRSVGMVVVPDAA
jgi:hypothetical protein